MKQNPARPSVNIAFSLCAIFLTSSLAPAVYAQLPGGGFRPATLTPRPSTPLEGTKGIQGTRKSEPAKPALRVTLVDPGPIGAETTTNLYFAQVAVGGGYTTVFTLMNTGATAVTGTLILKGQDGSDFTVNLNEPAVTTEGGSSGGIEATGSNFALQPIPPGGTRIMTAGPANAGDGTKSGWARVENIGGSLGGVGTFQQTVNGVLTTVAGVLSSVPVTSATIPVDNSEADQRLTGFAIANQNNSNLSVRLVTLNESGNIQDNVPGALNLAPQTQKAIFLHQILPARATFKGSMVLVVPEGQSFAVVALVINRGGLLTAIPVIPGKAPNVPNN